MEVPKYKRVNIKAAHFQLLLLLAVLTMLSWLFWALDLVFVPFNAYVFTVIVAGAVIFLTVCGVRAKERTSLLPILLPPLSGLFAVLTVLLNPLGFVFRTLLSLVIVLCCFVTFLSCTRQIKRAVLDGALGLLYTIAVFIGAGGVGFVGLAVWALGVGPGTLVSSPGCTATAEISRGGFDNNTVVVVHTTGANILVGRVGAAPQYFWTFNRCCEFSVYWVSEDSLKVYHHDCRHGRAVLIMHITRNDQYWERIR